jgi:hypothetical protein
MKQIYYTQCPIGYGLGASNGFQIKRLSPGYPVTGDFRHFSLRAFVAGTRTPAPAVLRYRRGEGDVAEVAWLTPRSHEYETERGAWGRPGGHFAHGLRLDDAELRRLGDWPAGLFDRPFWTRSDPVPTRGQPPPPLELAPEDLGRPPAFAAVAPMAAEEDVEWLARLLTALAATAREGRTLFLIDEPARLAEQIALSTFAFPEPWRARLTFSTYHDRPEELPGFRLQGTTAAARPNRPALLALGFVAERAAHTIEPRVKPAAWARTLAGWLVRNQPGDQADWESARQHALRTSTRVRPEDLWSDESLERLFDLPQRIRQGSSVPRQAGEWSELGSWTTWVEQAGLADVWVRAHDPAWWRAALPAPAPALLEASTVLCQQLKLPDSWSGDGRPAAWGAVVARLVQPASEAERIEAVSAALAATPVDAQPALVGALIRELPPEIAGPTLQWIERGPAWDRSILVPLKVPAAVSRALDARDPQPLHELLAEALAHAGVLPAFLDAVAAEVKDRPRARTAVAEQLAVALAGNNRTGFAEVQRWALGLDMDQGQPGAAAAWLGPHWHRLFAGPLDLEAWRSLYQCAPPEQKNTLTPLVLGVALSPRVPVEAFRWGIEELVLPIEGAERPHDPGWPGAYVDRLPSGLDLLKRFFSKEYRRLDVRRWLAQARKRGELSPEQAARIDACERYKQVLTSGDPRGLEEITLPFVFPEERGTLLAQMLQRLGNGPEDPLDLALDRCRVDWPGGFRPGAAGLDILAKALAEPLLAVRGYPELWFERLGGVLDRLGLRDEHVPGQGSEPDSLAAGVAAVTLRWAGGTFDPWQLRRFLLLEDSAWRLLGADVRQELEGLAPAESLARLDEWDHKLVKGKHTNRFFEVWLNACDPAQLTALVSARAVDLKNLRLSWWDSRSYPGAADDLRERFAWQAPLAPLIGAGTLARVRTWLSSPGVLSEFGRMRWRCLEELTLFAHPDETIESRWQRLKTWTRDFPLAQLEPADRNHFLGWLIACFPQLESDRIARLAHWLFKNGFNDPQCIWASHWLDDLATIAEVDRSLRHQRARLVSELRGELRTVIRDTADSPRKTANPGSP